MIVSNDTALAIFKKDLARCYVLYSDLLSHMQYDDTERVYFAKDEETFAAGEFILFTAGEDDVLIEVNGTPFALDEAIAYAKTKDKPIFLRLETDTAAFLVAKYTLTAATNYDHCGVFGGAAHPVTLPNADITVRCVTAEDVTRIASLPVSEWGNLPVLIRFAKQYDRILIAEAQSEIVGYLTYASSHEDYYDIVSVVTHSTKRGNGIGKALVGAFMARAFEDGRIPYYGEAKTAASAALAASMGFESLYPAKTTYQIREYRVGS